jgi:lysophospholipid acyltransferase (LPLAT)-like uncharacterized protein
MDEKLQQIYSYADLSAYSFGQKVSILLASWAFYLFIRIIGATTRFEIQGWENLQKIESDGKKPIYAFWHDRIILATYFFRHRGIVVMNSKSFDGEYMARVCQHFGYGSVRGSSSRRGMAALVEMIRLMKAGLPAGFTLDGPRGPRYVAKAGAVLLAKKTGNPLIAFVIEPRKFWTIRSWDKMQIPRPFCRARVFIAEPIYVSSNADDEEIEAKRKELQIKLDELVELGKKWRESITK